MMNNKSIMKNVEVSEISQILKKMDVLEIHYMLLKEDIEQEKTSLDFAKENNVSHDKVLSFIKSLKLGFLYENDYYTYNVTPKRQIYKINGYEQKILKVEMIFKNKKFRENFIKKHKKENDLFSCDDDNTDASIFVAVFIIVVIFIIYILVSFII